MALVSSAEIPFIPKGGNYRDVYSPPLLPTRVDNGQIADIFQIFPGLRRLNSGSSPEQIWGAVELDEGTRAHSLRVAGYMHDLHPHLEKKGIFVPKAILENGALLHDLGKAGLEQGLLEDTKLSQEQVTKRIRLPHVIGGGKILGAIGAHVYAPIARSHHERWDGLGYPYGLKGDQIPIGAQVVSVIDSLDTANERPEVRPKTGSLLNGPIDIVAQAGLQFGPGVMHAVINAMRAGTIDSGNVPIYLPNNHAIIMAAKEAARLPREL
jgi:hypothetical protein